MAQQKPLMLKEYLELESNSESFRWAPLQRAGGGGTTVRRLLETELRGGGLLRSHSTGALTRLSAAIRAVGSRGGSPSGLFARSFSKRLRRSFWKRSGHEEEEKEGKVFVKDIVRLRSFEHEEPALESHDSFFFCPSPVVSRLSSSSDAGGSTGSDAPAGCDLFVVGAKPQLSPRSRRSCSSPSTSPQKGISVSVCDDARRPSTCSRETKEMCGKDTDCPSEEEKEQLSPVSVMDFPYQDDDDDDEDDGEKVHHQPSPTSPSFQHFISNIERAKNQLLQQIRRFESLAELDPVDLDYRFARAGSIVHVAVDEKEARCEEEDGRGRRSTASSLLRRITGGESLPASGEKLLFDFFEEGLAEDRRRRLKSGAGGDEEMLRAASGWVAGGGCVTAEHGGVVVVWEMERSGGWRRFEEEEVVAAAEIAGDLVAWLMEELVDELVFAA